MRRPTSRHAALAALLLMALSACSSRPAVRDEAPPPAPAAEEAPAPPRDPCADLTVRFEPDTTTVRAADRAALHALADCVRDEERSVTIACHESGAVEADEAFAAADGLAHAVADALAARGVTPDQMAGRSHGNALPLCREDTPACHQQNRRCELTVGY